MANLPSRIAVLFGGPSPEHDVSILTALQAVHALELSGRFSVVERIYWAKTGEFFRTPTAREAKDFAEGPPREAEPLSLLIGAEGGFVARRGRISTKFEALALEAIVICAHGGPGEDGSLQGALDLAGVAYTGPSVASASLGMDKFATGEVVRGVGIPTLSRHVLTGSLSEFEGDGPYIVKPRFGGSSIGIDVVADLATAKARLSTNVHLRRGAVIEPYRADLFDLQIGIMSYPELTLSAIERPIRSSRATEILDYRDKYVGGSGMDAAARELPAKIDAGLEERIREDARRAAIALGVRGVARIDFLSDGEYLVLNEINTIPGSLSRHLFVEPVIAFEEILLRLLREAVEFPAARYNAQGADGVLLRDAKSIAAKLG